MKKYKFLYLSILFILLTLLSSCTMISSNNEWNAAFEYLEPEEIEITVSIYDDNVDTTGVFIKKGNIFKANDFDGLSSIEDKNPVYLEQIDEDVVYRYYYDEEDECYYKKEQQGNINTTVEILYAMAFTNYKDKFNKATFSVTTGEYYFVENGANYRVKFDSNKKVSYVKVYSDTDSDFLTMEITFKYNNVEQIVLPDCDFEQAE